MYNRFKGSRIKGNFGLCLFCVHEQVIVVAFVLVDSIIVSVKQLAWQYFKRRKRGRNHRRGTLISTTK